LEAAAAVVEPVVPKAEAVEEAAAELAGVVDVTLVVAAAGAALWTEVTVMMMGGRVEPSIADAVTTDV